MITRTLCLAVLLLPLAASAQDIRYTVTLEPGNQLRSHAPASVRIPLDSVPVQIVKLAGGMQPTLVTVGPPVKAVPAQIEFSHKADGSAEAIVVHWIEERLEPGQSKQYTLTLQPLKSAEVTAPEAAEEGKKKGNGKAPKNGEPSKGDKPKKEKGGAREKKDGDQAAKNTPAAISVPPGSFQFAEGSGFKDLFFNTTPIYRHMNQYEAATSAKPFYHLHGFRGDGFITKGPDGQFAHQRGIYLGWNKTRVGGKTYDFWKCDSASQRHKGYVKERETAGPVFARSAALTEWVDPSGTALVRDTREVTAWAIEPGEQTVLDFVVTMEALAGDVSLEGDPHHAGFQFRAAQEVAEHPVETQYVLPAGAKPDQPASATAKDDKRVRGKKATDDDDDDGDGGVEGKAGVIRNTDWVASILKIKGHSYAVILMNNAQVPRPAVQVVRSYGRLGTFFESQLRKGSPVTAKFRLVVFDADKYTSRDPKDFAAMFTNYREPLKGTAVPAPGTEQ